MRRDHPAPRIKRIAITLFVVVHLALIVVWSIPLDNPLVLAMRDSVRPYVLWAGLFQSWDMFAPNPKSQDQFMKAVVITKNRKMRVFAMPRMQDLSYGQRYEKERYRKFTENLLLPNNYPVLPDIVRHIARKYASPTDPPEKVVLISFENDVKDKSGKAVDPIPSVLFDDYVQPEDLK